MKRPATICRARQSPRKGILAVVAVVAKHKIFRPQAPQFAVADEALHLLPPERVPSGIGINCGASRKGFPAAGSMLRRALGEAIHGDAAITDSQPSRADPYPLDE